MPALPPYAHIDLPTTQCIEQAAQRYSVPELLIHSILLTENGRTGQCSKNTNGTIDCGLAQINSVHFSSLSQKYGIAPAQVVHDPCTNVYVSTYLLKSFQIRFNDWTQAIIAYNVGPNTKNPQRYAIGVNYARKVISRWHQLHSFSQGHKK